jgi:DNA-binding CsgD family transcriptional regulator
MDSLGSLDAREQALTFDLMEAVTCSLDLSEVLKKVYEVLSQMLAADRMVICVSKPGKRAEYDWLVEQMPSEFFANYEELADEDFVRRAVVHQPNQVLRDSEMLPRDALERSVLYQRGREMDIPLEQVMAVMLDIGCDWHGGFMLYRATRHPFSDRERALLQRLTPTLARTVRNCRMMGEMKGSRWMLESLLRVRGSECLVLAPPSKEILRTDGVTELLKTWFPPSERETHGLPREWVERLAMLSSTAPLVEPGLDVWETNGPGRKLKVTFVPLEVPSSRRLWALMLQETPRIPALWRKMLTKREKEVLGCLLQGWDNKTIAEDLKCSVDTVKKHLQHIYDKLGVDQRSQLMHKASQL